MSSLGGVRTLSRQAPRVLLLMHSWPLGLALIGKEHNITGVGCAVRICGLEIFKDLIYPICPVSTLQVRTWTFGEEQGPAQGYRESREAYQHPTGWYKPGIPVTLWGWKRNRKFHSPWLKQVWIFLPCIKEARHRLRKITPRELSDGQVLPEPRSSAVLSLGVCCHGRRCSRINPEVPDRKQRKA